MPIKLNTASGSITLIAEDGSGNANVTLPRAGVLSAADLTAGTGISIAGTTITNSAPDQTVALTAGSNVTITGTYPSFTIAATDTNTTYTAGTGLQLVGTEFSIGSTVVTTSGTQTLTNKTLSTTLLDNNNREKATVSATAATGTISFNVLTQQVLFYTSNASGNFTVNIRGDGSTTLNSLMAIGDSITLAFLVTNGGTAYYNTAVQVDGESVTPKWQGGAAPTSGNASSVDIYTYTIIKTAGSTFSVFSSQNQFA